MFRPCTYLEVLSSCRIDVLEATGRAAVLVARSRKLRVVVVKLSEYNLYIYSRALHCWWRGLALSQRSGQHSWISGGVWSCRSVALFDIELHEAGVADVGIEIDTLQPRAGARHLVIDLLLLIQRRILRSVVMTPLHFFKLLLLYCFFDVVQEIPYLSKVPVCSSICPFRIGAPDTMLQILCSDKIVLRRFPANLYIG
jgi:hypothetical protein